MRMFPSMNIVVVGAGIAGCSCAWELSRHGHSVLLLDKARKAGGRMATKVMHGARLDHGAQFFSARDERFIALVKAWRDAGKAVPWFLYEADDSEDLPVERLRGVEGMNPLPRELISSLPISTNFYVDRIEFDGSWNIFSGDDTLESIEADHLVLTLPVPQILNLFERSNFRLNHQVWADLSKVVYTRCIALLGTLAEVSSLSPPGFLAFPHPCLDWLCDNFHKGISAQSACTVHSSDEFARRNWDSPDLEVLALLRPLVEDLLSTRIVEWSLHRWRFAKPTVTFGASFWHDSERKLTLAGDGFGGGSVERAALSGLQAADRVRSSL